MRTLKEFMNNDELLLYFIDEYNIDSKDARSEDLLMDAIWEEIYMAEAVEAYEYCQRLVEFKDWIEELL